MSLQVWLPLNGSLNNQGLDGSLEFTNTASASVAADGKLGSCYSFSTTSGNGLLLSSGKSASEFMNAYINHHSWSLCAWIRTTSDDNVVFGLTYGLRLWCGSTNYIHLYNETRNVGASNTISTIDGKWHHICATYNIVDNAINIYVDGIKGTTTYYPSGETYASSWSNSVAIGRDFNNSIASSHYYFQGSMNDVRIYDHCLSAKEVKEISKGLICHYKLDNNGFGNPNLLVTQSPSEFSRQGNTYTSTEADSRTNDLFHLQYFTGSTYVSTFYSQDVSVTPCDVKTTFTVPESITGVRVKFNGASNDIDLFGASQAPVTPGETYTLSLRVLSSKSEIVGGIQVENPKLEKGSIATSWCPHESDELYYQLGICGKNLLPNSTLDRGGWENLNGSAILQDNGYYKVIYSGGGWWGSRYAVNLEAGKTYIASCKGYGTRTQIWFYRDGSNCLGGNINTTNTPQFLYVKYTPTTSGSYYIICKATAGDENYYKDVCFYECNEEIDCSGLSNNGTKIGGLTPSTSPVSVRYESCYDFDGSTGSMQIPNLSTLVPNGEFTMNCWIYHDNTWSSKGYETIFGGPSGFELEAKNGPTNSPALYACNWGKASAVYELNKWNMITMTRNASETKFYINGELKITGSAGTIPSGNYFIGAWNTSNEQNYKGKISDFRLYSTVLSASDIKELYNTSASVDKNGNMYAYEFKEE